MNVLRPTSMLYRAEVSFGFSIAIFSLGAVIESTLHACGVHGVWEWLDNGVCAVATGMLIFAYEQRQYKRIVERLRVIAQMNHHVRNALQPILYMPQSGMPPEEQLKIVRESVARIRWALTEILPGEFAEYSDPEWQATQQPSIETRREE